MPRRTSPPNIALAGLLLAAALGVGGVFCLAGCGSRLLPLEPPARPGPDAESALEVVAGAAGGADPLPVAGGGVSYAGVARAAGAYVAAAARPWAERHRPERPGGWQMVVELTLARADVEDGMITVELETRVTLRARAGLLHRGQTRGYCKATDAFSPRQPTTVATRCLERMGRDLADWLEGVAP
jgi:hypothetical protein